MLGFSCAGTWRNLTKKIPKRLIISIIPDFFDFKILTRILPVIKTGFTSLRKQKYLE